MADEKVTLLRFLDFLTNLFGKKSRSGGMKGVEAFMNVLDDVVEITNLIRTISSSGSTVKIGMMK